MCRVPRFETFQLPIAKAALASDVWTSSRGGGIIGSKAKPGKAGLFGQGLGKGSKTASGRVGARRGNVASIRPLVVGNWKMHGLACALGELKALKERLAQHPIPEADVMVCPPATLLAQARYFLMGSNIKLGAQDCHALPTGAHTGDISAEMLADAGAAAVIVGHSERRTDHGETDSLVKAKANAAHRSGLTAIICIGETEQERREGATLEVVKRQLQGSLPEASRAANTVIAYEPVWAIGSGLTPTPADVAEVHGFIRGPLGQLLGENEAADLRILYGGSVKPANASELLFVPDVNGALVGGASLKAADFYAIASVYSGPRAT
jgi:triosephosphate isomerase